MGNEGLLGGVAAIREHRARSHPHRAAPVAAAPACRLRSRSPTRAGTAVPSTPPETQRMLG
eukprot:73781-Alexandrium_andersonii.AAC.1